MSRSEADLAGAERDLERTELRAPFSGRIAERDLDAFQEIGASKAAFVLLRNYLREMKAAMTEPVYGEINAWAEVPHADVVKAIDAFMAS